MISTKIKLTKADRTKQYIIESMSDVFNKKGYSGTSITDIEATTGLSRGAIYGNFASKEEIALAVFDFNFAKTRSAVDKMMERERSFHAKIMVLVNVHKSVNDNPLFTACGSLLYNSPDTDEISVLMKDRAISAVLRKEKTVADLIQMGMKSGEFRKETDPKQVAIAIISLLEGGLMIWRKSGDSIRMSQVIASIEALMESIAN